MRMMSGYGFLWDFLYELLLRTKWFYDVIFNWHVFFSEIWMTFDRNVMYIYSFSKSSFLVIFCFTQNFFFFKLRYHNTINIIKSCLDSLSCHRKIYYTNNNNFSWLSPFYMTQWHAWSSSSSYNLYEKIVEFRL